MIVLYCSETWDLKKCEIENEKLGKWYSVHANSSQFGYIFQAILEDRVKNISSKQKQEMKKIRKSKINLIQPSGCDVILNKPSI